MKVDKTYGLIGIIAVGLIVWILVVSLLVCQRDRATLVQGQYDLAVSTGALSIGDCVVPKYPELNGVEIGVRILAPNGPQRFDTEGCEAVLLTYLKVAGADFNPEGKPDFSVILLPEAIHHIRHIDQGREVVYLPVSRETSPVLSAMVIYNNINEDLRICPQ